MKYACGSALLIAAVLTAGCDTFYQNPQHSDSSRQEAIRIEMARQQAARELDVVKARGEAVDFHLQQINTRLDRLEGTVRETGAPQADIAALRREVEQLREDRTLLKKEIVDELSREFAKLLAVQNAAPAASATRGAARTQGRQAGYEHKVQAGQTLSEIASAYKVSVDKIKQANGLNSDIIRVGQVLFVPD